MPVIQTMTREDIRLAVGHNCNAVFEGSTTSASAGTDDIIDRKLRGGTNDFAGQWIIVTSGARDGDTSQVFSNTAASAGTAATLTVRPVLGGALANSVTYEKWDIEFQPLRVHNWINQSIQYATGMAYDPEEDVSLHLNGFERRYVIPSNIAMITKLERRASFGSVSIDQCETGWTQQTNVTQVFDQTQRREGGASLRLVLAAAVAAADNVASKTITSLDISKCDRIGFWIRSSVAAAAGDFTLRLTSGSTTVAFNVPALVANTWHFHRVTINPDDARQLTAVTTVVLRQVVDIGAATLWLDGIRAEENSSAEWEEIRPHNWYIDKEAGEIVFKPSWGTIPYNLLKITGGDRPVLLNADATASEVDPMFVIAKATELALMATSGGPQVDPVVRRQQAAYWAGVARERIANLPVLQDKQEVA